MASKRSNTASVRFSDTHEGAHLLGHDPSPDDGLLLHFSRLILYVMLLLLKIFPVIEGKLADCYFLAALSVVSEDPERIRRLFITQTTSEACMYTVRFIVDGIWRSITVDDHLPFLVGFVCPSRASNFFAQNGRPAFGRSKNPNELLWVPLIEKAYAKLYGSYRAIIGGNTSEALRDLTADFVEDYNLEVPYNLCPFPRSQHLIGRSRAKEDSDG